MREVLLDLVRLECLLSLQEKYFVCIYKEQFYADAAWLRVEVYDALSKPLLEHCFSIHYNFISNINSLTTYVINKDDIKRLNAFI